jgi:hypothetical protein
MVQATLRGDGIGCNQAGKNACIHFVLESPEAVLAGRIGKRRLGSHKTLCLRRGG